MLMQRCRDSLASLCSSLGRWCGREGGSALFSVFFVWWIFPRPAFWAMVSGSQ